MSPLLPDSLPPVSTPPSFTDFKFSVIGQPPQLLKRMSAASATTDFRHSPTPVDMDLDYPSRAESPGTPNTSAPSSQQRLASLYLPIDTGSFFEQKPIINGSQITNTSPLTTQQKTSISSSNPALASSPFLHTHSITQRTATPTPSSISLVAPFRNLNSDSTPQFHPISTRELLQIQSAWSLSYQNALVTFEKAERNLALAQETYDAAKTSLAATAMARTSFLFPPFTDVGSHDTGPTGKSRASSSKKVEDAITVSVDAPQSASIPHQDAALSTRLPDPTFSSNMISEGRQDLTRLLIDLEREADDVRLAWSSDAGTKLSSVPDSPHLGTAHAAPILHSSRNLHEPLQDHVLIPPNPQHAEYNQTTPDAGRSPKEVKMGQVSSLSTCLSVHTAHTATSPPAVSRAEQMTSTPASSSNSSSLASHLNRDNNSGEQPLPSSSTQLYRLIPVNLNKEDTVDDETLLDPPSRARSESRSISLGNESNNEVERDIDGSLPCSPISTNRDSRSSSVQILEPSSSDAPQAPDEVPPSKPVPKANISGKGNKAQGTSSASNSPTGSVNRHPQSAEMASPVLDKPNTTNENTLLQRIQPTSVAPPMGDSRPKSPPLTPISVLGKRRYLDAPTPLSPIPLKRRTFTNTGTDEPTALESRIGQASAHAAGAEQPKMFSPHARGGYNHGYKRNLLPRNKFLSQEERPTTPPTGPRAVWQETHNGYYKHGNQSPDSQVPALDRPLGSDTFYNKFDRYKNYSFRKKQSQDGTMPSSLDRPLGTGRGGIRLGQHHVTKNVGWERDTSRAKTGASGTERRGYESISLADRLRDP